MVIKVNEKGILYIDDVEKKITDLTSEFLENIVLIVLIKKALQAVKEKLQKKKKQEN